MFSFGESNSFPSSYYHSPPLTIQENNTTFSQQTHHQNLFQGPYNYIPSLINPLISENLINNNVMPLNSTNKFILEDPIDPENTHFNCPSYMINNTLTTKKAATKKDRHTKICTAQGVRDRRVRLSISIAREFFNLQDMLGFDKASKTLGWLLAKSKFAIDELASSKSNNNGISKRSSSASDGEVKTTTDQNTIEEEDEKQVLSGTTTRKKRGRKDQISCNGKIDAREVRRAKARERARERTKNKKMMNINLNNQRMENSSSSPLHQHHHQRAQQNLMISQSNSGASSQKASSSYGINPAISVGESVVIKNKLRRSRHNHYHDHDHDMNLKDYPEGCSYNNDYLTKFALESNSPGVLRQGFPSLNIINLSTEIRINGKPWETSSNQILH